MAKKENIFLFVADQMRSDSLHHLGNEASITPNLDQLLEDGISYENAYCQNPVCVPSRCSFLTGLYPHTTGHRTMHYLQKEYEPNILKEMKQNGYEVIWIGRNDVIPATTSKENYCDEYYDGSSLENVRDQVNALNTGSHSKIEVSKEQVEDGSLYSFYIGKTKDSNGYGKQDWMCVQSALDYLERKSKEKDGKPFFVYCTISFPHPPYGCEDPWFSSIDRHKLPRRRKDVALLKDKASMLQGIRSRQHLDHFSEEQFNEIRATYLAMVSRFDHQFGLIVDKLKETQFYDDTNIVVFSDHGDYTGDYQIVEKVQNCFEDPVSNVPLLIKPAHSYEVKPRISRALVELCDLPATLSKMAGFDLSYVQFGKSLIPTFSGSDVHKDAVFCEGGRIAGEEHCKEKGHNETSPYYPRLATQSLDGPEHTKAIMIRMNNLKYTMRLYEKDELYDLDKDPYEEHNCIDDLNYQSQVQMMRSRLLEHLLATGDFVPLGKDPR